MKEFYPGNITTSPTPLSLTNVDGTLYFSADDGVSGRELWTTDGTPEGTVQASDFSGDSSSGSPEFISLFNGRMIVVATNEAFGRENWIRRRRSSAITTAAARLTRAITTPGTARSVRQRVPQPMATAIRPWMPLTMSFGVKCMCRRR